MAGVQLASGKMLCAHKWVWGCSCVGYKQDLTKWKTFSIKFNLPCFGPKIWNASFHASSLPAFDGPDWASAPLVN